MCGKKINILRNLENKLKPNKIKHIFKHILYISMRSQTTVYT